MSAAPAVVHAVDYGRGVSDAWASIALFIPKLLFFAIVLVVGYFLAKVLAKVVDRVLERVGFDRAVERGGVKQAMARSQYDASDIVAKLVKYTVMLFTLVIAFNVFGPNPISNLLQQVIAFLPNLIVAIVIVVVAAAIAKVVKDLVSNTLGGLSYGNVVANIASVFILFLGVVAALNQIGVATTVTTPILITILATVGGVIVVGAGGGLIRPMQSRWERWLNTAERESENVKAQVRTAPSMREQAGQLKDQYKDQYAQSGDTRDASSVDVRTAGNGSTTAYQGDPNLETRQL
ncbi:MAG: hypothetical protein QOJ90_623 [Actinomycetota bacterium]|jgi:small-conductance mechanosensitive channel|nr:hypothetical protein [Actinomycetota bacterium]